MRSTLTFLMATILGIGCKTTPQSTASADWNASDIVAGTRSLILESQLEDPYYGGKRHLLLQCWYPIEDFPLSAERADYLPFFEVVKKEATSYSEEDLEAINMIKTRSLAGVRIKNKNDGFPVLLFSPALGSHTSAYTYLAEELVSAGYVVIGINHQYESEYVVDPVGRYIPSNLRFHDSLKEIPIPDQLTAEEYRAAKAARQDLLAADVGFVLNELKKLNPSIFDNQLDFSRLGAWGHSIGGAAVTEAARSEQSIKAVANLDGTPTTASLASGIAVPFMYLEDLADYRRHPGYKLQFDRRDAFCARSGQPAYRVLFAGIDHASFYDYNYQFAKDSPNELVEKKTLDKFVLYLEHFFDRHILTENISIEASLTDSMEIYVYPKP